MLQLSLYWCLLIIAKTSCEPLRTDPNPEPYVERNEDGTFTPYIRISGKGEPGEGSIYEETLEGFTVKKIGGYYKYLELAGDDDFLVDSGIVACRDDDPTNLRGKSGKKLVKHAAKKLKKVPSGLSNHVRRIEEENGIPVHQRHYSPHSLNTVSQSVSTKGTLKNLVVTFKFSDHTTRTLPSKADLTILMNNIGPHALCPTGSVRDVYLQSSFNQISIESTVADWVTLPKTEAYYANGDSGLTNLTHQALKGALDLLEATGFDFTQFDVDKDGYIDAITFVHSGYAAEFGRTDEYGTGYSSRMWSHKWSLWSLPGGRWTSSKSVVSVYNYNINPSVWSTSGSTIGRIGVISHELGHYLGMPDLYDGSGGSGIGSFGLMANSWGFGFTQYYPPHMDAWCKIQLGWVTPTVITSPGTYTVRQACDYPDIFRIDLQSQEYLLIENRQKCDFDNIPGAGGLAIFHIDELASDISEGYPGQPGWPSNGKHYRVALLQADGYYHLEKGYDRGNSTDLFSTSTATGIGPAGLSFGAPYPNTNAYQNGTIKYTGISINSISVSSASMTFTVSMPTVVPTKLPTVVPTKLPTVVPSKLPTVVAKTPMAAKKLKETKAPIEPKNKNANYTKPPKLPKGSDDARKGADTKGKKASN